MPWIVLYVVLALAGLTVLALLALRLWRQVRDFGRQVSAASERLAAASEQLSQIDPPGARRS